MLRSYQIENRVNVRGCGRLVVGTYSYIPWILLESLKDNKKSFEIVDSRRHAHTD